MSSLSFAATIDRHFGVHADALVWRSQRSRVLASNLSNADTPNYKARDMDFSQFVSGHPARAVATHPRHIGHGVKTDDSTLLYRHPFQPTLDGNTVETEVEQANFARNAIEYQASLMFLSGKIRGLRDALKGGQ